MKTWKISFCVSCQDSLFLLQSLYFSISIYNTSIQLFPIGSYDKRLRRSICSHPYAQAYLYIQVTHPITVYMRRNFYPQCCDLVLVGYETWASQRKCQAALLTLGPRIRMQYGITPNCTRSTNPRQHYWRHIVISLRIWSRSMFMILYVLRVSRSVQPLHGSC